MIRIFVMMSFTNDPHLYVRLFSWQKSAEKRRKK